MRSFRPLRAALPALALAAFGVRAADDPFALTPALTGQAVFSCNDVVINGNAKTTSALATGKGHVLSNGKITVSGSSIVDGNATAGPGQTVTVSGAGRVNGTKSSAVAAAPCTPIDLTPLANTLRTTNDNARIPRTSKGNDPLSGSGHTDFVLNGNDSITLPAGTYYFTKLVVNGNAVLSTSGLVKILSTGTVDINGETNTNPGTSPFNLRIWTSGTAFTLNGNANLSGFVYAPNAALTLNGNITHTGAVFAKQITLNGGMKIVRRLDESNPSISLSQPREGDVIPNLAAVSVRGTATDADSPVTVTVNGTAVPVAADGTFSTTADLRNVVPPAVTAIATDALGNVATVTVNLCSVHPTVSLDPLGTNGVVDRRVVDLAGSYADATSVTVNGRTAALASGHFTLTAFDLGGEGDRALTIVAAGACGSTTINATASVDTAAPAIAIDTPREQEVLTRAPIAVGGTVSDPHLASVKVNGITATVTGGRFAVDVVPLLEGPNALQAVAVDTVGHSATHGVAVYLDTLAPSVVITAPHEGDVVRTGTIAVEGTVESVNLVDVKVCSQTAVVTGSHFVVAACALTEGDNPLVAVARDRAGLSTDSQPVHVGLDTQMPVVALDSLTSPTTAEQVTVRGTVSDAHLASVTVNGVAATVSGQSFSVELPLTEGTNAFVAHAVDVVGNAADSEPRSVERDTQPPSIAITVPASDACLAGGGSLTISGTYGDTHPASAGAVLLEVRTPDGAIRSADGVLDAAGRTWTASGASLGTADGSGSVLAIAKDALGQISRALVTFHVDANAPVPSLLLDGGPFPGAAPGAEPGPADTVALFSRAVTPRVLVADGAAAAPPAAVLTLDGASYAEGMPIAAEGTHLLVVRVSDCAGHEAAVHARFTLDLTPPRLLSTTPAAGASVGSAVATFSGSSDPDLAAAAVNGVPATVSAGSFALTPFAWREGANSVQVDLTDAAGNRASYTVSFTVKTLTPTLEILESGSPIPAGAVFLREIAPVVRTNDPQATLAATLNGAPFTSGTAIRTTGDYVLDATASDSVGHTAHATVAFHVDLDPDPTIAFTAPEEGAVLPGPTVTASGTTSASTRSVSVNGRPATLTGTTWTVAGVPLEADLPNELIAVAADARGRTASASRSVTVKSSGPKVLILAPAEGTRTNRRKIDLVGAVLGGAASTSDGMVHAGLRVIPIDASGGFRATDVELSEGDNVLTVSATDAQARTGTASVHVAADFTAPAVAVTTGGHSLEEGAALPAPVSIHVEVSDAGATPPVPVVRLNGRDLGVTTAASDVPVPEAGGYVLSVVARDAAGNETRLERSFVAGAAGCRVSGVEPADGASVSSASVTLHGRAASAAAITIRVPNPGTSPVTYQEFAASLADGTFAAADVPLPAVGDNALEIVCADASGARGTTTLTLHRLASGGGPAVRIALPVTGARSSAQTLAVSGTVSDPGARVWVNGQQATVSPAAGGTGTFTLAAAPLAEGPNVLAARAVDAAGRSGEDRVVVVRDATAPRVAISSPTNGSTVGNAGSASGVDVVGSVDLANEPNLAGVSVSAGSGSVPAVVDPVTGAFVARGVPLASSASTQTITATATDLLGQSGSASVQVTFAAAGPAIRLEQPVDQARVTEAATSIPVTGDAWAAEGAQVSVNGGGLDPESLSWEPAGADGRRHVRFTTAVSVPAQDGPVGVVASVEARDGKVSTDRRLLLRDTAAPTVVEIVPADGARQVDANALLLVLFSEPVIHLDGASGLTLTRIASGDAVVGTSYALGSAVAFVPGAALARGESYRLRAGSGITDVAGHPLASAREATFTVALSATDAAPALDALPAVLCQTAVAVKGTSVPGATIRVRDEDLSFTGVADSAGRFSVSLPLGRSGYHHIHVVAVGSDGVTTSPEASALLRVDCTAPVVTAASLDRGTGRIAVTFSEGMSASTLAVDGPAPSVKVSDAADAAAAPKAATLSLSPDGTSLTIALDTAADAWWRGHAVRLNVGPPAADRDGNQMSGAYETVFFAGGDGGDLSGAFLSGEVYDEETGRPLPGVDAQLFPSSAVLPGAAVPPATPIGSNTSDAHGRFRFAGDVPAARYALVLSKSGYTRVVRRLPLEPATGAVPFDARLTPLAPAAAVPLGTAGGTIAGPAGSGLELAAAPNALASSASVQLTPLSGQGLPELLPLGYTPLAAAHVRLSSGANELPEGTATPFAPGGVTLTLPLPAGVASDAALLAVRYDVSSGGWLTLDSPVRLTGAGGAPLVRVALVGPGAVAVVLADTEAAIRPPAVSGVGSALLGATLPESLPALTGTIRLDPPTILPTGRSTAYVTARTADGSTPWPSGLAVQAYLDEKLVLEDGGELYEAPFTADLVLYHPPLTPEQQGSAAPGAAGAMAFRVSPSPKAAQVLLQSGYDDVRLYPFPEQLERGSVLGPAGGSVTSPDGTELVLAEGALAQRTVLKTTRLTAAELAAQPAIEGWDVVAGVRVDLGGATLARPATLKVPVPQGLAPDSSGEERLALASFEQQPSDGRGAFARVIARAKRDGSPEKIVAAPEATGSTLPLEGLLREGLYLFLHAKAPIGYVSGLVLYENGYGVAGARTTANGLGTADMSLPGGSYVLPAPPLGHLKALHPTRDESGFADVPAFVANQARTDIVIRPTAPTVAELQPRDGASGQPVGSVVSVRFSEPLDRSTVTAGTVDAQLATADGSATGAFFIGNAVLSTDGTTIVFTPSRPFPPARRIICRFIGGVRDAGGTPYQGAVVSWSFTTSADVVTGGQVHPERFHLEVPIDGRAHITADADAVPRVTAGSAAWSIWAEIEGPVADPVKDTLPAVADGSVDYTLGHPPSFAVTIASKVWVHVIDPTGTEAAAFRLGPFVTPDHLGFVAPPGEEVHFTSAENVQVDVPAAAFDEATLVRVSKMDPASLGVSLNPGLEVGAYVNVDFDGQAKESLRIKVPVTTAAPVGSIVFLGTPTDTPWGTRLQLLDLGSIVDGGNGTKAVSNADADQPGEVVRQLARVPGTTAVPKKLLRSMLLELTARSSAAALYSSTLTLGGIVGWIAAPIGAQFSFLYNALADSVVYKPVPQNWDGHFVLPTIVGSPLEIVRRDTATGWILDSKTYAPITGGGNTLTDIGNVPTGDAVHRPRMLAAQPFQFVTFPLEDPKVDETCLRITFEAKACATRGGVSLKAADDITLPADTRVDLFRLSEEKGLHSPTSIVSTTGTWGPVGPLGPAFVNAPPGTPPDELLMIVARGDLDAEGLTSFRFVFDRGLDAILPEKLDCPKTNKCLAILEDIGVTKDVRGATGDKKNLLPVKVEQKAGRSEIVVTPQGVLPEGHTFRLSLDQTQIAVTDDSLAPLPPKRYPYLEDAPHEFVFATRPPAEELGTVGQEHQSPLLGDTNLARDFVKTGGLLIVGTGTGNVVALDASKIALKKTDVTKPFAVMTQDATDIRALAADRHNRVFFNSLVGSIWGVKALRVEDVRAATTSPDCSNSDWQAGIPCFKPVIGGVRTSLSPVTSLTALEFLAYAGTFPFGTPIRMELLESDETNPPRPEHPEDGNPPLLSVPEFWKRYGDYREGETFGAPVNGFYALKLKLRSTHQRKPDLKLRAEHDICSAEKDWDHYQRVTVDDVTTGQSWSFDIHNEWSSPDPDEEPGSSNGIRIVGLDQGVRVRAGDQLRVRFSLRTFGYIAMLGSGITVVDLNRFYRTTAPNGVLGARKGDQCGRRLARYEGQDLPSKTCPSDAGTPLDPGVALSMTSALAIRPEDALTDGPAPGPEDMVDGVASVYSPLVHFGGVHSRHFYGKRPVQPGHESDPVTTFDAAESVCMRPRNASIPGMTVTFRDVAVARSAAWIDRGVRDLGEWKFDAPKPPSKDRTSDLVFFSAGDSGVLAFDIQDRKLEDRPVGRYRKKGHLVFHVAVSEDGKYLLAGGTNVTKEKPEPFIDVWDISRVNGGPEPAEGGDNPKPESDPRLLASFKAPWDTNHVYLDETGTGLLFTWGNDEMGARAVPVEDPQFVFDGVYRSRVEPAQGQKVSPVRRLTTTLAPLGIPGRVSAKDDADIEKRKEIDRELTAAFKVRVALPGDFGDELVAKVQSLRALPEQKRLLSKKNLGPAVALPGGPGWPQSEVWVRLLRLGKTQAASTQDDAQGATGKLSVAWQEYESKEVVVLLADPRARKDYTRQKLADPEIADEGHQCRRCERPEHYTSLKELLNLEDKDFRELLAGGRYVRAILAVPPPPQTPPDPNSTIPVDRNGWTQKALDRFEQINTTQDNYLAPSGVVEVNGWADEIASPAQIALKEPALNPAFLPIEAGAGVHLVSGEAALETTDHFAGGRSLGFEMDRTWRSGMLGYGPLGAAAWTSSLLAHLRRIPEIRKVADAGKTQGSLLAPETIEFHDGTGSVYRIYPSCEGSNCAPGYEPPVAPEKSKKCPKDYEVDSETAYCMPKGLYLRLQWFKEGAHWEITGRNHDKLTFDADGQLFEISDRHHRKEGKGSALKLAHDPFGQLVLVEDDLGRRFRFEYEEDPEKNSRPNPYGLLKKLTDFADRELKYEFDDKRRLATLKYPQVTLHGEGGGVKTPELTYDYSAPVITAPAALLHDADLGANRLRSWKLPEYQGRGEFRLGFAYKVATAQLERIEYPSGGNPWLFAYTPESAAPATEVHVTSPFQLDTTFLLKDGRLETRRETVEVAKDAAPAATQLETKLEYKDDGRVKKVTRPDSTTEESRYAEDETPPRSVGRLERPNVLKSVITAGDAGGSPYAQIDTSATYDEGNGHGNALKQVTDGEGREIAIPVPVVDDKGEAAFRAESVTASSDFDAFGRTKRVEAGTGADRVVTEAEFEADKAGRPDAGLVKKLKVGESSDRITEEYTRDERGNVTDVKRSDHSGSNTKFDEWDRPYEMTLGKSDDSSSVQPVDAKVSIEYDAAGHVARVKRSQKKLPGDVVVEYAYDERERVKTVSQTYVSGEEPEGFAKREETFHYDDKGLLTSTSVAGGVTKTYDYDFAGRVKSVKPGSSGERKVGYDEMGRVVYLTDGDQGVWKGKFDGWGRLYQETFPNDAVVKRTFDMAGGLKGETVTGANQESLRELQAEVTSFGALKSLRENQGAAAGTLATSREFDTNGRLKTQRTNERLDADVKYKAGTGLTDEISSSSGQVKLSYPSGSAWPSSLQTFESGAGCGALGASVTTNIRKRDAFGRVITREATDGTRAEFDWDEPGNLLSMTTGPTTLGMDWDSAGNVRNVRRSEGSGNTRYGYDTEGRVRKEVTQAGANSFTTEYHYDDAGRIQTVSYPDQSTLSITSYFDDDMVKTATLRSGVTITNVYDKANHLLSRTPGSGGTGVKDGGQTFGYDGGSRLVGAQRLRPDGTPDTATAVRFDTYDLAGHPKNETVGARPPLMRAWDSFGREKELHLPAMFGDGADGLQFTKSYESCSDRLKEIVSNAPSLGARWAWQGDSKLIGITTSGPLRTAHRFGYFGAPGGPQEGPLGKLGTLMVGSAAGTPAGEALPAIASWSQLAYGYRAKDGARLGRQVMAAGPGLFSNQGFSYGLDVSRRLARASAGVGSLTGETFAGILRQFDYTYDESDHLKTIVSGSKTVTFASGPLGRPESREEAGSTSSFAYDGAGRRTQDDRFLYDWYWYGRLAKATVKSGWGSPYEGHQIRFTYDALGRLFVREHFGPLPQGDTDDAHRPFVDKRDYVWDDKGLVRETSYRDDGSIRWRKSWTPGEKNLDDQVQMRLETFQGSAQASQALYAYLRDENGSVLGVVDDAGADPGKPRIPVRYLYTPFGEAHAETGPELRRARFDGSVTSVAGPTGRIDQTIADPTHFVAGALLTRFSVPIDPASDAGFVLEKCIGGGGGCAALPASSRAIDRTAGTAEEAVILPLAGWERGVTYRVRLTGLRDGLARPLSSTVPMDVAIPAASSGTDIGSSSGVVFDRTFDLEYDSFRASGETAGDEIAGGQPLLFQGAWTDPVTGLAYHRARWYDPRNASWLSEDPEGPVDSPNLYAFVGQRPHEKTDPLGLCLGDNVPCWDYVKEIPGFVGGTLGDAGEAGLNLVTVGGYGGVKKAQQRGELARGGLAGGKAYLLGMANFLTLGYYGTATDTLDEGGTFGDATKTWAGDVSGYTDIAEGGTKLGEGEYIEGAGRVVAGTGKIAGWLIGARASYAKTTGKPLMAFGRNIGAQRGVQANRAAGNAVRDAIAKREGTTLIEQRFKVTGGERVVDVLKVGDETLAIESKVGLTKLTKRVRQELARDMKMLRSGQVDKVRWEFTRSARTGRVGPNAALAQKLKDLGFEVKINE